MLQWLVNQLVSFAVNVAAGLSSMTGGLIVGLLAALLWVANWHRRQRKAGLTGVEPAHLIIGGLVGIIVFAIVALGGFVWQQYRAPDKNIVAKKDSPAPITLSPFEWGFERHPGYFFIGMSADADKRILVHFFQAQGFNRTKDPITKVHAYVRSDRTNAQYPIYFNLGRTRATESEINPIPVDAIIDIRAPFLPNNGLMPVQQFLNEIVPFTFFFEYDGKQYRRTFVLDEIEPLIRGYEQEVRKSSVKPPQMTAKQKGSEASPSASQLLALHQGRSGLAADKLLEPFKGNRIAPMEGKIGIISPDGGSGGVMAVIRNESVALECHFGETWMSELSQKKEGDSIRVTGEVDHFTGSSLLVLRACEVTK